MIMGVEGFVKTRIKSKHFYTILKVLCTYFYYKYELRRFKIDMTVRLSNDTLSTYLQVQLPKFLEKSWKVYWFFGTFFKKYWTIPYLFQSIPKITLKSGESSYKSNPPPLYISIYQVRSRQFS